MYCIVLIKYNCDFLLELNKRFQKNDGITNSARLDSYNSSTFLNDTVGEILHAGREAHGNTRT